jgi:hypothetical protein
VNGKHARRRKTWGRVIVGEIGVTVIGFKETPVIAGHQRENVVRGEFLCGGGELWPLPLPSLAIHAGSLAPLYSSHLSSSPFFSLFLHDQRNAHDFLFQLSLSSCVDLTVDHTPPRRESIHYLFISLCLPATPQSAFPSLDVNPLLRNSRRIPHPHSSLSFLFHSFETI